MKPFGIKVGHFEPGVHVAKLTQVGFGQGSLPMLGVGVAVKNSTAKWPAIAHVAFPVVCMRTGAVRDSRGGVAQGQVVDDFQSSHVESMAELGEPAAVAAIPTGRALGRDARVDALIEQPHPLYDVRSARRPTKIGWIDETCLRA